MVFTSPELADLHADFLLQKQQIELMEETIKDRDIRILQLEHQLAGIRRARFGATSESSHQYDLSLAEQTQPSESETDNTDEEAVATPSPAKKRKPIDFADPIHPDLSGQDKLIPIVSFLNLPS